MPITPQRLRLALEQLGPDDGFEFERFANAFLAPELPGLRPVGGVHDGGRDAFIHKSADAPTVFCQHSVTAKWRPKVRCTITTLRKNGHQPRELIYCTNRPIVKETDDLRAELRRDGVVLDVRDRHWFEAVANSAPARVEASERLAQRYVDPLLSSSQVFQSLSPGLTDEEERIAATYLQIEVQSKSADKGLTRACIDAIVMMILRDSSPEKLVPRSEVHRGLSGHLPGSDYARAQLLADNGLSRLIKKGRLKHHTKEDAFAIAYAFREEARLQIESLLSARSVLLEETTDRVEQIAAKLGVDFEFTTADLAADALTLLDAQLCEQGRMVAVAMARDGEFFAPKQGLEKVAEKLCADRPGLFCSLSQIGRDRFVDVVPLISVELAAYPSKALLKRLRVTSDAYCLQFALQQTEDVQGALRKVISGLDLLVLK